MSDDIQYLQEALEGKHGEDARVRAEETCQELGYSVEWEGAPEGDQMAAEFGRAAERLEKHLGRSLTEGEVVNLVEDIRGRREVPDLVAEYGPQLEARASRRGGSDEWKDLAAEEIEETDAHLDARQEEAALVGGPSAPATPDEGENAGGEEGGE